MERGRFLVRGRSGGGAFGGKRRGEGDLTRMSTSTSTNFEKSIS